MQGVGLVPLWSPSIALQGTPQHAPFQPSQTVLPITHSELVQEHNGSKLSPKQKPVE